MRCLHCGNEVSLLKKLSDPQFCSAEHRQQFYDDQQGLILQRLQLSASRLQQFRRGAVRNAPAQSSSPDVQVPSFATFCAQCQLDLSGSPYRLLMIDVLGLTGADVVIPTRASSGSALRTILSPPVSILPWARYNPGLLSFAEPAWETVGTTPGLNTPRLRRRIRSSPVGVRSLAYSRLSAPEIVDIAASLRPAGLLDFLVVEPSLTWKTLRIEPVLRSRGVAFLDRVFRMRLKSGVGSGRVPSYVSTDPRFEPFGAPPVRIEIARLSNESGTVEPGMLERFFRARPRAGVDSVSVGRTEPIEPRRVQPDLRGVLPVTSGVGGKFSPREQDRFFRPRPRGPVDSVTGAVTLAPSPAEVTARPAFPASPAAAAQIRVKAGAAAGRSAAQPVNDVRLASYFRPAAVQEIDRSASPVLPLREGFAASPVLEPNSVERLFRMRPRSGVADPKITGLVAKTEVEPLCGRPAVIGVRPSLEASPAVIGKLYKGRPRGPVPRAEVAEYEAISAVGIYAVSPLSLAHPVLASEASRFELNASDRLYRMRPRAGVSIAGAANATLEPRPEPVHLSPAVLPMEFAERAPGLALRMFRPRPRGPVDCPTAPVSQIDTAPIAVGLQTARGGCALKVDGAPAPAFLNRVFRTRPGVPVQDESTLMEVVRVKHLRTPDPDPVFAVLPISVFEKPEPAMLEKLYRMRPRNGRTGAADNIAIPPQPVAGRGTAIREPLHIDERSLETAKAALRSVSKNWKTSPMDLKAMVMMVPVLLFIAMTPFYAKSPSTAHAKTVETSSLQSVVERVGHGIRNRAAISIGEDFRSGLGRWTGPEGWEKTWTPHDSGYITPSKLGLLIPTMPLKDYRFEFSGQIVSKALGFVVRASDDRNYHAIKFKLSNNSSTPSVSIVRTAVVDGKEVSRKVTPLILSVASDTVYHVTLDVNDQYFTLMIRDKVVDFWSDALLKSGGIGFFADKGEQALIHNVRVKHHYDTLGRLVAAALPAER